MSSYHHVISYLSLHNIMYYHVTFMWLNIMSCYDCDIINILWFHSQQYSALYVRRVRKLIEYCKSRKVVRACELYEIISRDIGKRKRRGRGEEKWASEGEEMEMVYAVAVVLLRFISFKKMQSYWAVKSITISFHHFTKTSQCKSWHRRQEAE